jgi:hypothetical protein
MTYLASPATEELRPGGRLILHRRLEPTTILAASVVGIHTLRSRPMTAARSNYVSPNTTNVFRPQRGRTYIF